mgnify:CR=1 FL=1
MQKVEHIGLKPVGEPGAVLVISGRWNESKEYTRDSEVIPLVEFEGLFYSLNKVGTTKGGLNPKEDYAKFGSKATWKLQNSYEMIIVKAVVADGGLLGDFVFWGGKMFSKQGVDRQGNFSDRYTEYPSGNFIPNYTVDAITGEIVALKGKFGLLEIIGNTLVGKSPSGEELIRITGDQVPDAGKFSPTYLPFISELDNYSVINQHDFQKNDYTPAYTANFETYIDELINLDESGEYRIDEATCFPREIINVRTNRDVLEEFRLRYYATTSITLNGKVILDKKEEYLDRQDGVSPTFFAPVAGSYRVYIGFLVEVVWCPEGDYRSKYETSIRGMQHKPSPSQCTFVGSDGLYSSFSTQDYLHYKAGEGITLRAGNHGLRVTKLGIQKWNGSKWIAANI